MNRLPEILAKGQIQLSMTDILESAKEGLLAVAVQTGMQVLQAMLQEEVKHLVGEKGKHNPDRQAVRHGTEKGSVRTEDKNKQTSCSFGKWSRDSLRKL